MRYLKSCPFLHILLMLTPLLLISPDSLWAQARPTFLPVPEGVVELTGFAADGGIVEAKDGSLMLIQGGGLFETGQTAPTRRVSTDGGKTWSAPTPLKADMGAGGVIRLQSGALAMYGTKGKLGGSCHFCTSPDDGQTWTAPVNIGTYTDWRPMFHSMIQLQSGRIVLVGYWEGLNANPPDAQRYTVTGSGLWRGRWLWMEGHRGVEMGICIAYYSDDEGKTWSQCKGGLFGWFDERGVPNGEGGILDVYEPTAAETKDGRVLMFARSKVGRLVQSYSLDRSTTWYSILPTELSSSQSPPMLVRIPSTGDLLCIWNQVSIEEIQRGFLRGRLSVAISKDSGLTWENFKTLERQEGMEDVARIAPEYPIPRVTRARPGVGQLPDAFAMFSYVNVDIVGDKVFVRYLRTWAAEEKAGGLAPDPNEMQLLWKQFEQRGAAMTGDHVMRIYPLDWFYN
ncbi:MAG: sialidase family protein [Pirellulaceae bacterium]